jgi:hypothetical protein
MDHFKSDLRKVIVKTMAQRRRTGAPDTRYGIAPLAALLTACGATNDAGKLRLYLFSEAVRTFTGLL